MEFRADIKSYYKSIRHHILLQEIKRYYGDPSVCTMLENIVKNPIETPRGYKNPDYGIATAATIATSLLNSLGHSEELKRHPLQATLCLV
jgi:hypothetical protein